MKDLGFRVSSFLTLNLPIHLGFRAFVFICPTCLIVCKTCSKCKSCIEKKTETNRHRLHLLYSTYQTITSWDLSLSFSLSLSLSLAPSLT